MTRYRIPVRVVTPPVTTNQTRVSKVDPIGSTFDNPKNLRPQAGDAALKTVSCGADQAQADEIRPEACAGTQRVGPKAVPDAHETGERKDAYRSSEREEWRERALRLQAEMATFRPAKVVVAQ